MKGDSCRLLEDLQVVLGELGLLLNMNTAYFIE